MTSGTDRQQSRLAQIPGYWIWWGLTLFSAVIAAVVWYHYGMTAVVGGAFVLIVATHLITGERPQATVMPDLYRDD